MSWCPRDVLHGCAAPQTRSAASNPKGPYLPKELTAHRPSLQSEYSKLVLEQALDAAIDEARKAKQERSTPRTA
jgi:hypothetical protein